MKQNDKRPTRTKPKSVAGIARNRLQELRERGKSRGGLWLTVAEVARLREIDVSLVYRHENHQRPLTDDDVTEYAKILKVQSHQIFQGLTVKRTA